METKFKKIFTLLAFLLTSYYLYPQGYGMVLNEGFENGIPQDWVQEKISGDISWVVESEDPRYRPSNVFDGQKRLAFRNETKTTQKARTRLILPIVDLSQLYQPILVLAHAQDRWASDFDTLKVLYRTSEKNPWIELKVFDKPLNRWQLDTLRLNGATRTYQIALEATDNLGHGIVLDNVQIRSTPNCIKPYNIRFTEVSNNAAVLNWIGAFDAPSFAVRLSTVKYDVDQIDGLTTSNFVFSEDIKPTWKFQLDSLTPATKYYCYIKSNCHNEVSDWVVDSFLTANVQTLPYVENFNVTATPGYTYMFGTWYVFSNDDKCKPFINSYISTHKDYYSADETFALAIAREDIQGADIEAIPGRVWAYAATPLLDVDDMSKVRMSWKSIRYNSTYSERFSVVVGVMIDPANKQTFEPVDTINIENICDYYECFVSFENYKGQGKYIAFMSDFEESNMFIIDDLDIHVEKTLEVPDFKAMVTKGSSIQLNFNNDYAQYEVVVSESVLTETALNTATTMQVANKQVIDLQPNKEYFVYARAVSGENKGDWSFYKRVRTIGAIEEYPMTFDFNITNQPATSYIPNIGILSAPVPSSSGGGGGGIGIGGGGSMGAMQDSIYMDNRLNILSTAFDLYPSCLFQKKGKQLYMRLPVRQKGSVFTIFPEMIDPLKTDVRFYLRNNMTQPFKFYVGVMSDANDINSFQVIDTITHEINKSVYFYTISKYNVTGKFFAFKIDKEDFDVALMNELLVDDVVFSESSECSMAQNVRWRSAEDPSTVILTWNADDVTSWNVRLADTAYDVDSLDLPGNKFIYNTTVNTNSIEFKNLIFPKKEYFFWIQPICGGGQPGKWSFTESFVTECRERELIPYVEDFENQNYSTSAEEEVFTVTCMGAVPMKFGTSYYPYIAPYYGTNGLRSMIFSKDKNNPTQEAFVSLPRMAEPLKKLQLSFSMYCASTMGVTISVGVMKSPLDTANIEIVSVIKNSLVQEHAEFVVTFDKYEGTGEYITLITNAENRGGLIAIDDIRVDYINSCRRPENLELVEISTDNAKVKWIMPEGKDSAQVVLTTQVVYKDSLDNAILNDSSFIVSDVIKMGGDVEFKNLKPNTKYYVYVRTVCGKNDFSRWSNYLLFRTNCVELNSYQMGVETFDTYEEKYPSCYTVGNKMDPTATSYIPTITSSKGVVADGAATKALKIASSAQTANGAYAITPIIGVDSIARLRMKLYASARVGTSYAQKLVVGVVNNEDQLSAFAPIDTLELTADLRQYEVYFNKYEGDDYGIYGRRVMFLSEFDQLNEVYIDNVVFDTIPECFAQFSVVGVSDTSVSVKFTSSALKYEVKCAMQKYTSAELDADTLLPSVVINGKVGDITGLAYNTQYYLYARAICGENYSEWTPYQLITTDCYHKIHLPYSEDFEESSANSNPTCWNSYYSATSTAFPKVVTTPVNSGTKAVQLKNNNATTTVSYIATAEIDVERLSSCRVIFYACPSVAKKNIVLSVGAVSDINNISGTFEEIETVNLYKTTAKVWEEYIVSLKKYQGTAKHIAFKMNYISASTYVYLDDITVEFEKACYEPEAFSMESRTDKSLTLSFVHYGAISYDVNYGPKGFDNATGGTKLNVTDTVFTINSLSPNTEYDVYVRANCTSKDVSDWVFMGTYATYATPLTDFSSMIDFEKATENASWGFAQADQTNQWYIGTDAAKVVADGKSGSTSGSSLGSMQPTSDNGLYITFDTGTTANYDATKASKSWAYRTVYLAPGVYTVSYDWTCYGETTKDYFRACLAPVNSSFQSGSANVTDIKGVATGVISTTLSQQPVDWFDLSRQVSATEAYNNSVDTTKTLAEQWQKQESEVVITPELAGTYNLVFYWENDDATATQQYSVRGAVVDNIAIKQKSCCQPYQLSAKSVAYDKGYASWKPIVEQSAEYVVLVTKEEVTDPANVIQEQIAFVDTVNTTSADITGLDGSSVHYVYVKTLCSADNSSQWIGPVSFETFCAPYALGTIFSFDNPDDLYLPKYVSGTGTNSNYNHLKECFTIGDAGLEFTSSNAKYIPYVIKSSTTKYSRSGDYSLCFYATTSNGGDTYLVLPLVDDEDSDELVLSFWMRPFYEQSTGKLYVTYNSATYARMITVGVMTDPNDPSTYRKLKDFEYFLEAGSIANSTLATSDPTGEKYWMECILPLKDIKGKYIVFKNGQYAKNNCVYIDDIQIAKVSCVPPVDLNVKDITSTTATIEAIKTCDAPRYLLQLATDNLFENVLVEKVSEGSVKFELDSLLSGTHYYARLQSLCSEGESSSFSTVVDFSTPNKVSYDEDFSVLSYCPADWKRASNTVLSSYTSNLNLEIPQTTRIIGGWNSCEPLFEKGMFSTRHISVSTENQNKDLDLNRWLVTPEIELKGAENYQLTFDLALTDLESNYPIAPDDLLDTDDKFVVAVNDNGKLNIWHYDTATTWQGDKFKAIPHTGEHITIDLSEYAGKEISVAFYVRSSKLYSTAELHLDNVHVNAYEIDPMTVSLCDMVDYWDENFDIKYEEIQAGKKEFSRTYENKTKEDRRVDLGIQITPSAETFIEASICKGDVYDKNNFSQLTEPGIYKQKLPSANGCDSVVILDLKVIEPVETLIFDTICYGQKITWRGKEYDRGGTYSDTLTAVLTKCDSIVRLVLNVREEIRVEDYKNICFGETYQFGSQEISKTGDYTEKFISIDGCDSVVTLHATVLPNLRTTIRRNIAEGESYSDENFVGLTVAGTYTTPYLESVDGCDSTITLILTVGDVSVAVDNVVANDLILVPNPVKIDGKLYVQSNFTKEDRNGLVVEVFNSIGQLVYVEEPTAYPIIIEGLNQRGVYLVRITSGRGNIYQSKVVVE